MMNQHILTMQDFIDTMTVAYSKDEDETYVSVKCLKVDIRKVSQPDYIARQIELEFQIPQQIFQFLEFAKSTCPAISIYKIWDWCVVCTGKVTAKQIKSALKTFDTA